MRKISFLCLFIAITIEAASPQPRFSMARDSLYTALPDESGVLGVHQAALDANNGFTLMSVAAHPDDEDIFTIVYYRRKFGARAVVVVSNRGEGGQNEIGPELYTDLAVVRSHEMHAAEQISGSKYYNLNFVDFGYSKNVQETFDRWGRDELTRRLVRMIRRLRPHVIITNHDETSGHSNHQAVGRCVRAAFQLAGDSTAFRQQLRDGLHPWQPWRLFQRVRSPKASADVQFDIGEFDPIWGTSYSMLAARAMAQHRSQGFDKFARSIHPGSRIIRYKLIRDAMPEHKLNSGDDLFSGLADPLDAAIETLGEPGKALTAARQSLRALARGWPDKASQLARRALEARDISLARVQNNSPRSDEDRQALQRFAQACNALAGRSLGIYLAIYHRDTRVTPGDTLLSEMLIENTGAETLEIQRAALAVPGARGLPEGQVQRSGKALRNQGASHLLADEQIRIPFRLVIPQAVEYTEPEAQYIYNVFRRQPNCLGEVLLQWRGHALRLSRAASVAVAPQILLQPEPAQRIIVASRTDSVDIPVLVRSNRRQPVSGQVNLRREDGVLLRSREFALARQETFAAVPFRQPAPGSRPVKWLLEAVPASGGSRMAATEVLLKPVSLQVTPGVRVGVIQSYDPTLMQALQQMQVQAHRLSHADLLWGNLQRFEVILVDIRAYLVRRDLRAANERLLQWVRSGGRLVVMYQKVFEWNPEYGNPAFAPYPLHLSHNRVTDETAQVTLLQPGAPLLNHPNKLSAADWDGWVQERGLYFADAAAPEYQRLLSMHDPGEEPLDTSLLAAKYGKGEYIYTSLVWYRQLRALQPGAFRMLANMVSWKGTAE